MTWHKYDVNVMRCNAPIPQIHLAILKDRSVLLDSADDKIKQTPFS